MPLPCAPRQAIEANQYFTEYEHVFVRGDVDACFAGGGSDHVIEGTFKVGGQEHFYLETNAACVIPQENDEFLIVSSTQVRTWSSVCRCKQLD